MEFRTAVERAVPLGLAATLGLFCLSGCGESPEVEKGVPGVVVEHVDHPAYITFIHAGKVNVPVFHPEEFGLEIRQCDREGDPGADNEGCVTAEAIVDKQTYDAYPDGSSITLSK